MSNGYWRFVIAAFICLVLGSGVWLAFSPERPNLPTYQYGQGPEASYQAGGSGCKPEALARLRGEKAATEANRCAEASEEHRLKSDDLVQQTRSATATEVSAGFAYEVTRLTLVGLIIGLFTTVAAGFAAYYARRAYLEAMKARVHQEWASQLGLQPFVYWKRTGVEPEKFEDHIILHFEVALFNAGPTPALNVRWDTQLRIREYGKLDERPIFNDLSGKLIIPPNSERRMFAAIVIPNNDWEKIASGQLELCVGIDVLFDSRFAKDKVVREYRCAAGDHVLKGRFFLDEDDRPIINPFIPGLLNGKADEGDEE